MSPDLHITSRVFKRQTLLSCLCFIALLGGPTRGMSCYQDITEETRCELTTLRTLDSIAPNSVLRWVGGNDATQMLLGDNGSMSVYGLDASFNTKWSWSPSLPQLRPAELFGVRLDAQGRGTCLATQRGSAGQVYRCVFREGLTIDAAPVPLPNPAYHVVQDVTTTERGVAFTARVSTPLSDSLFAYVVDTVNQTHHTWKVSVTEHGADIGGSAIRIIDTTVVVVWHEGRLGFDTQIQLVEYGLESQGLLHRAVLSDYGSPRFAWSRIWVDTAMHEVGILGVATQRGAPIWGVQRWSFNTITGRVDSAASYLPDLLYLKINDVRLERDRILHASGYVMDVDPVTFELMSSTSRGVLYSYDAEHDAVTFRSMREQRPTKLTSVRLDRDSILALAHGDDDLPIVARLHTAPPTSVSTDVRAIHDMTHHIAWYAISGAMVQSPSDGVFIDLRQCEVGCQHAELCLYNNGLRIGLRSQD